jgi:hypothetical protein
MEAGDDSIIACYDDLVDDLYKLTNAPAGKVKSHRQLSRKGGVVLSR